MRATMMRDGIEMMTAEVADRMEAFRRYVAWLNMLVNDHGPGNYVMTTESDTGQTGRLACMFVGGGKKTMKPETPKNLNQWDLADNKGRTVAHEAACRRHLPENFNQWDLADDEGWTVAHEAASYGYLPENFDQ